VTLAEHPGAIPLAAEDRAILALESTTVVGHVCHVVVVAPDALDASTLRDRFRDRLDAAPELRYRLGGTVEHPVWVPADDVDLADHIIDATEGPVGAAGLRMVVADRFSRHLDRARPLWAIDVVGLTDGATALVWRLHHALADGTTAVRLADTALFDEQPTALAHAPPAPSSSPAAVISRDHARRRAHLLGFLEREFAFEPGHSPFDGAIGTRRDVAFADTSFSGLHAVARAAGATVNDVVLSVVAGALRRWLDHHAGRATDLRVRVPVSLHHEGADALNRDSYFDLPLPLHIGDPMDRLRAVHHACAARKSARDATRIEALLHGLTEMTPSLARLVERAQASPRAFAVNISNVVGPGSPVAVLGREVRSVRPIAEIGQRHALRIGAMSTADVLAFGLCADPGIVEDVDLLMQGLEREIDLLVAATG
jgi:diacylglycerol O-acyltransferase / wax synthase